MKRRLTVGGKAFMAAVQAEIDRRDANRPVAVRTLFIDFDARTVGFQDGHDYGPIKTRAFALPILTTEHPVRNEMW